MENLKSKRRRFPVKRFILFVFLIILLVLVGISELGHVSYATTGPHPEPVYNRSLSESEMALPFDGYRNDFLGERSIKVDYPAPLEKLKVEWIHRTYLEDFDCSHFLGGTTDSQGGVLFFSHDVKSYLNSDEIKELQPRRRTILIRLNPDNSISWKRLFYYDGHREYIPVAVCNGAVVWQIKSTDYTRYYYYDEMSLECIDNDGNTVWRSDIYKPVMYNIDSTPWRISGNRIMAYATGRPRSGTFNIFSLSDGKLIESIKFPGWNCGDYDYALEPIEIPGKGWIGFQRNGIVLFDSNLKKVWKQGIPAKKLRSQPCILNDLLIVNTGSYIAAINIKSGKIIWKNTDYSNAEPELKGSEKENNIVFFTTESRFISIDNNGKPVLSTPYEISMNYEPSDHDICPIVYSDGEILVTDSKKLSLFDKSGKLIWVMNLNDMGFSPKKYNIERLLNYAPDDRLVLFITSMVSYDDQVVSLKFNEK